MHIAHAMGNETILCEERINPLEEDESGMMFAGRVGETDYQSLMLRRERTRRLQESNDYRACIPCDRCGSGVEIRGFTKAGKEKLIGYVCRLMDCETNANNTCNMARLTRKPYRRVLYILQDAPRGFREGMTERQLTEIDSRSGEVEEAQEGFKVETTMPKHGYHGGSGYYNRADGDKEAVGSGRMPVRLTN